VTRRLGIDVGGSATRWHLIDQSTGTEIFGETIGFSGHISKPEIMALAKQAINTIAKQVGLAGTIVAGVTGLSRNTDEAVHLSSLLRKAFSASSVLVMSDIELAARAAFPLGEGILIYAGTGSIAAHMTDDGQLVTAGGKGILDRCDRAESDLACRGYATRHWLGHTSWRGFCKCFRRHTMACCSKRLLCTQPRRGCHAGTVCRRGRAVR
jgi:hypothetical protein